MMQKPIKTKRSPRPTVIGTGLVALDAVVSADPSIPVRFWAGGTCANVLTILRYLGWTAKPVARLGIDEATDLLLEDLRHWKLSERFIRIEADGSTPFIVERIRKDVNGQPKHSFSWRCTECGSHFPGYKPELASIAEEIAPKAKKTAVFFFDRLSAGALVLARAAAEAGALVVFEPCSIGNPILFRQAWEVAHVVKYSHERLSEFPEMNVESNPRLVIETLGDSGLRYRRRTKSNSAGNWIELKAIPVTDLKDTAGAGDWCTAGLLSKVAGKGLAGFSATTDEKLAEAIRFGQALAAWNCKFEGARGGMYATTKKQFQNQVDEILSGTSNVIPTHRNASSDSTASITFCRTCDHSVTGSQKRAKSSS
jgi:sugar/nucleoside kinase (ribokinase family)